MAFRLCFLFCELPLHLYGVSIYFFFTLRCYVVNLAVGSRESDRVRDALLLLLQVVGGQGRGGRAEK